MSKRLTPDRIAEALSEIAEVLDQCGGDEVNADLRDVRVHIEALESELAARDKQWAEQTVQRCDATARIQALEADIAGLLESVEGYRTTLVTTGRELAESRAECEQLREEVAKLKRPIEVCIHMNNFKDCGYCNWNRPR